MMMITTFEGGKYWADLASESICFLQPEFWGEIPTFSPYN